MGPFYGVLLAILTFFGTTSLSSSILGADISVSLTPDTIAQRSSTASCGG